MKIIPVVSAAIAMHALATIAFAQVPAAKPDWEVCEGNSFKLEDRLAACDALVSTVRGKHKLSVAYLDRGAAHKLLKQQDQALSDYTMAITLNPELPEALIDRAELYRETNQNELALADYRTIVGLHPHNAEEFLSRGVAFDRLGDLKTAFQDYDQVVKRSPSIVPTLVLGLRLRASALYRLGRFRETIDDANAILRINRSSAAALYIRGIARHANGEVGPGDADVKLALSINPQLEAEFAKMGFVGTVDFSAGAAPAP